MNPKYMQQLEYQIQFATAHMFAIEKKIKKFKCLEFHDFELHQKQGENKMIEKTYIICC